MVTGNIITKYLAYKKSRLVTYALTMQEESIYRSFLIECLTRYINNYIEVVYHQAYETLDENTKLTKNAIKEEQNGIMLELLDELSVREILESNEGYKRKQEIIKDAKDLTAIIIKFDQEKVTEANVRIIITKLIEERKKTKEVGKNAEATWYKEWQITTKTIKKVLEPKKNFTLNQVPYSDNLWEISILPLIKQLNMYKKSLVERVNQEEKIICEKIKLSIIIITQTLLRQLTEKTPLGNYIIPIPEEIWTKKQVIEEVFLLLDDKIIKEHVMLGITYQQLINNKTLIEKKKSGYHFVCYQNLRYINDTPTKIDTIDATKLFDYLMITDYKGKDKELIEKQEPTNMKAILFSKE